MKVYIPTKQEKEKNIEKEYITTSSGISDEISGIDKKKSVKININTATQIQLETLPGIGPSTASKIVSYRNENGKFKTIESIKEVSGIGDFKFEKIKDFISV